MLGSYRGAVFGSTLFILLLRAYEFVCGVLSLVEMFVSPARSVIIVEVKTLRAYITR